MRFAASRRVSRRSSHATRAAQFVAAMLAAVPSMAGQALDPAALVPTGLSFVAACEIPHDARDASGRPIGGLSGIARSPGGNGWLAVSDDQDAPRWYRLSIGVDGDTCRATVLETVDVSQAGVGARAAARLKDAEGIAALADGRVLISTEGDGRARPIIQPGVFEVDARGHVRRRLPLPERFAQRPGKAPRGVRDNAAFESLASSPDGQAVFTATEEPLLQDGRSATFGRGGLSRLLEYRAGPDGFVPSREFALPLEPIRHPGSLHPEQANSGAVDLLALDRGTLLLLERAFVRGRQDGERRAFNDILVSRLSLADADDVTKVDSLNSPLIRPVRKDVIGRLSDIAGALPTWLRGLDNFEGMAAGPELPGGTPTVVLVSDDNFNARQRTAFLVLRLVY